jgi:hypothetical protein
MYIFIMLCDNPKEIGLFDYTRLNFRYGRFETTTIYEAETFKNELIQLFEVAIYEGCTESQYALTLPLLNDIKRLLFKYCQPKGNEYSRCKQWDFRRLLRDCAHVAKFLGERPNGKVTLIIHE